MISVIIPAYNAEKFIQHTIESVLNQSYKDFEVVVVNDGSSDSTRSIVEDMADKYGNIRLINQPNEGVSSARNTALGTAVGILDQSGTGGEPHVQPGAEEARDRDLHQIRP